MNYLSMFLSDLEVELFLDIIQEIDIELKDKNKEMI